MSTLDDAEPDETDRKPAPDWFSWDCITFQQSHLLETISLLTEADSELLRFIFNLRIPALRKPAKALLQEAAKLGSANQLVVQAAIDLWSGEGNTSFSNVLATWDSNQWVQFIRAICHLKEIREEVMHGLIDDQNGGFCL